ncbi:MAG: N-acetylmuramoyl-L-alanine amidase [Bacteroidetes bacterium]|nr:N-acetylmuramoyl-L-alanine amidase [Bacteroidota bacterium]
MVLLTTFSYNSYSQKGSKIKTIVIDAGHGGKDPGASGKHSREKDIALSVALKTGGYIEQNFPNIKVIYTRKTDKFVDLHKRGQIANENNADLFISIHCNANPSSNIYGAETYVLGVEEKRTKRNMDVAMMENAAILLEDDAGNNYNDFDPKSPESLISLTLFQDENLDQSLSIAQKIQQQFTDRVGRKDRSVYQAGFLVLWKTSMPSVLVELGYLSNNAEEKFLNTKEGQVFMASAIYRAFKEYKIEFEKENNAYEYRKQVVVDDNLTSEPVKSIEPQTNNDVVFKVQFYTSPRHLALSDSRFQQLSNISKYEHNGLYKYTSGSFTSLNQAKAHQKKVQSKGFTDAFVVAFHLDNRISISEAVKLEK